MLDGRKNWITLPRIPKDKAARALFRRSFTCEAKPAGLMIHISADSRYKLYVNEIFVEAGPCKGDREIWYYDSLELSPYLQEGDNTVAVEILSYPAEHGKGNYSIFRTGHPGLFLTGTALDADGEVLFDLSADEQWKGYVDPEFSIVSESKYFAPLLILENRKGQESDVCWKSADFDDSSWENAVRDGSFSQQISPGNLCERPIPFLYRRQKRFAEPRLICGNVNAKELAEFLNGQREITVLPQQKLIFEANAGEEETGYLHLLLAGGKGGCVRILTSEGYVQEEMQEFSGNPVKKNRLDRENGHLHGFTDTYYPAGNGKPERPEEYSPFWFRTFRFVRVEIEPGEEPLTILDLSYEETGYPLEVKTSAGADDPDFKAIWDISERTLRRCMHETYEDCPFYEQLQYIMDSRSQILYTYAVSADDRLARKCMEDLRRSQRYDGLLNSCHPNYEANVIPGFSIYYILMLYDHMMYFADKEFVRSHIPSVDRILQFFHENLTKEGYVGKIGGLNGRDHFWSFIDWAPQWKRTSGVPAATLHGAITMESLLYIYGLQTASRLADFVGLTDLTGEYKRESEQVQKAVRENMTGERHMLTDGPGIEEYSQHTQVFAVLTDTVDAKEGRRSLLETVQNSEEYAQCSVAMAFYLYRALEKADLYEYTREYWGIWRRMLKKNASTCIEDEVRERSDCHAWGALLLYELPAVILGVRMEYGQVLVRPVSGYLHEAEGRVITPKGDVYVHWQKDENGRLRLEYREEAAGQCDKG